MNGMGKHNAAAILALTLVWTGCSIKEDRMICPCFLTEEFGDVSPVEEGDDPWISILGEGGGVVQQKTIHGNMFREGDRYVATVPKQILSVAVTYGMKHYTIDGGTAVLSGGFEADSVYAHTSEVDCTGETASDTVRLHKQWCTLDLVLKGSESWKPFFFEIHGGWNAVSLRDMSPVKGPLTCVPRRLSAGRFRVRIPRQGDNALMLLVYDTDDFGLPSTLRYDYPVGELLENKGYDWKRKDLDDAVLTIDYAKAEVNVEIAPWDEGTGYKDITI